mmetsp:Transcript_110235/g.235396  ORF Transcript_110235/g.235396 Transcript_110235/m.235396 type:complete len:262 (-) Transcript_110235:631-1416(-)
MQSCRGKKKGTGEMPQETLGHQAGIQRRRCLADTASLARPTVSRPRTAQGSEGWNPIRSSIGKFSASQKRRCSQTRAPRSTPETRPESSTPRSASQTSTERPFKSSQCPAWRTHGASGPVTPTCLAAAQLQDEYVWPRSTTARNGGPLCSLPLHTVPRRRAVTSSSPWVPCNSTSRASRGPKPLTNSSSARHAAHTPRATSRSKSQLCRKSGPKSPAMPASGGPKTLETLSGTICTTSSPTASPAKRKPRTRPPVAPTPRR